MLHPTYRNLQRHGAPGEISYCTSGPHPNARLYKSYFQVFTKDSPWEGKDFFERAEVLCMHDFGKVLAQLVATGTTAFIYHRKKPRLGGPFDPDSERWKDVSFAPAWEDDPDPECNGYK